MGTTVNESEWRSHIEHFKDLLRVPVGDDEEGVRHERASDIGMLHDRLPNLLFESYQNWFDQDDDWILRNLSLWLTDDQDSQLLALLYSEDDRVLLTYLADTCLPEWLTSASEGGRFREAGQQEPGTEEQLVGAQNSTNWNGSRTPGTYYYVFDGTQYRYSDQEQAPASEWAILPDREQEAARLAQPWGEDGAWCTPTHGAPQYGEDFVFSLDRDGPWVGHEEILRWIAETVPATQQHVEPEPAPAPVKWDAVWTNYEDGDWKFGLTESGPWTYTDGEVALADQSLADDAVRLILDTYPNADPDYMRELAVHFVDQTSR